MCTPLKVVVDYVNKSTVVPWSWNSNRMGTKYGDHSSILTGDAGDAEWWEEGHVYCGS